MTQIKPTPRPAEADNFWDQPAEELLRRLESPPQGLSQSEAEARLRRFGPNSLVRESRWAVFFQLFHLFLNPLVIILLIASGITLVMGENVNAVIIIAIVLMSILLNFYQEFQARHAAETLKKQVASTAAVLRDGKEQELPPAELVPGDIIIINAGDRVPADARLLSAKDLYLREAALTGESLPNEKRAETLPAGAHSLAQADNSIFMGTAVQSGLGTAVVVRTGSATAFGDIAAQLAKHPPETEFDRGIRSFGGMITRVILLLVLAVFLINISFKRPLLEAFLFAVALAVGMTPELLPMIISVTLAQGARRMAKQRVIVKQLASIENFGSMEILCSDKTGTLTEGEIVLDRQLDSAGRECERVLQLIYLNSHFEAGIHSPLDDAVLKHSHPNINEYRKVDELPFDFARKRLSVVVARGEEITLISKGAVESIFSVCTSVAEGEGSVPFDDSRREIAAATYRRLSEEGYRVLGVATRPVPRQEVYQQADERDLTLAGFAAFLDPPKPEVGKILQALREVGIAIVIMTGDNQYVTKKTAQDVGLPNDKILAGPQIDALEDAALAYQAEQGAIFAQVSPEQKNRIILALKNRGRVVGFLGDGINDAPSLHAADVGISVMNGVEVAKDAASIILLEKDLGVLLAGVKEGRRSFANIMKYIIMGTSSNFGNMFSMAAASLFLPFLPMLPTQILLNNFLYDASQISIPSDNVDGELMLHPRRWQIAFIRRFMMIIGPISSIYDFLTFGLLLWVFKADARLFHTGWFVESLLTQTLVVFVIRTAKAPFRSRPSRPLLFTILGAGLAGAVIPYTGLGRVIGFDPMPPALLGAIAGLTVTYLALVQLVKSWFYRKHSLI
jgi:P-type Mg2+ transporter